MNISQKTLKSIEAALWLTITVLCVTLVSWNRFDFSKFSKIELGPAACTQQQVQSAVNVAIRIADDVCQEAAQQGNDPAWITLICSIIDPATGKADMSSGTPKTVSVTIPRVEWVSLKSAQIQSDAGAP